VRQAGPRRNCATWSLLPLFGEIAARSPSIPCGPRRDSPRALQRSPRCWRRDRGRPRPPPHGSSPRRPPSAAVTGRRLTAMSVLGDSPAGRRQGQRSGKASAAARLRRVHGVPTTCSRTRVLPRTAMQRWALLRAVGTQPTETRLTAADPRRLWGHPRSSTARRAALRAPARCLVAAAVPASGVPRRQRSGRPRRKAAARALLRRHRRLPARHARRVVPASSTCTTAAKDTEKLVSLDGPAREVVAHMARCRSIPDAQVVRVEPRTFRKRVSLAVGPSSRSRSPGVLRFQASLERSASGATSPDVVAFRAEATASATATASGPTRPPGCC
jgi:hypothetical protein